MIRLKLKHPNEARARTKTKILPF